MTGDAETLAEWFRHSLRLYMLPSNVASYHAATDDHETVAARGADFLAEGVLASGWLAGVRDEAAREVLDAADRLALNSDLNRDGAALARALRNVTALRAAPPTEDATAGMDAELVRLREIERRYIERQGNRAAPPTE